MRALIGEALRFALVGTGATAIHLVVAWLAYRLAGLPPYWANAFAFVLAFGVSYFGHASWTFRGPNEHARSLPRFLVVASAGYGLSNLVIWVVVDNLHQPFELALLVMLCIVPTSTWLLARFWAFRS